MSNRGERDFYQYRIFKYKLSNNWQEQDLGGTANNEFTDTAE